MMRLATPLGTSWWIPASEISVPLGHANMTRTQTGETMKTRALIKYGAIALLLGTTGFTFAIGALTLIFAPQSGAYAPVTSSDAAAWIQAVGSIGAIVGAFLLGKRQAQEARKLAQEMVDKEREIVRRQYKAMLLVVIAAAETAAEYVIELGLAEFDHIWQGTIRDDLNSALSAFASVPMHGLGNATEIYESITAVNLAKRIEAQIVHVMSAEGLQANQYVHLQREIVPPIFEELRNLRKKVE